MFHIFLVSYMYFYRDSVAGGGDKQPPLTAVFEAMLKECRKDKMQYKLQAIEYLGQIADVHDVDVFASVWQILHPLLEKVDESEQCYLL